MQLGQSEALCMFNHHQRGIRYINPDFNHRRRDQHMDLPLGKRIHGGLLLCRLESSMNQTHPQVWQRGG